MKETILPRRKWVKTDNGWASTAKDADDYRADHAFKCDLTGVCTACGIDLTLTETCEQQECPYIEDRQCLNQ